MANKDVQESIAKLVRERPRELLDSMMVAGWEPDPKLVSGGLRFLVEDFRRQAELVMDSGARGKGAEATALRAVASQLSLLADAVEQVNLDAPSEPAPAPSRGGPKLPAEWCGSQDEHGPHVWTHLDGNIGVLECTGHHARDTSGLKALVSERAGVQVIEVPPGLNGTVPLSEPITGPAVVAFQFAAPAGLPAAPDLKVEEGDTLTTLFAAPAPLPSRGFYPAGPPEGSEADIAVGNDLHEHMAHTMTVERVEMPDYLKESNPELEGYLRGDDLTPAPEVYRTNTPELKKEAAAMFAAPAPAGTPVEPEMPGRRLTFAELLAPPPIAPPEHMSYSQIGGMSCGTQYRLTRLEPGVIERPRWANVGGTALHAAVEWFEKQVTKAPDNAEYARARIRIEGGVEAIWGAYFGQAVTDQCLKTPEMPPDLWKESGRHVKEGYTWWLTQGEDMLRRYLDGRLVEIEQSARVVAGTPDGQPIIEHEGVLDVDGVPVKVVIDQAWVGQFDGGAVVIEDVKSGGWAPDGTFQLGLYAWYLRKTLGWEGQILGRFWDARKGTYGEPVDLIEAHPWEEVQLRVLPEAAKKKALLFSPNPSFGGCKSCMVQHACPAAKP